MLGLGENVALFFLICYFILTTFSYPSCFMLLGVFLAAVISYLYKDHTYWRRRGVPSPPENLIWGNMLDLRKAIHTYDVAMTKRLGKTFGCRAFGKHELVSSDFDIIRQVLMKDFASFANRTNFIAPNPKNEHNIMQNLLILKEEENWKRIRTLIAPAFSTVSIKKQITIYNDSCQDYIQLLETYASNREKIPLQDVLSRLTLSIGVKCAFDHDIDVLRRFSTSPFLENAKNIFDRFDFDSPRLVIMAVFPGLVAWLEKTTQYQFLANSELEFFKGYVMKELYRRSETGTDHDDFFQMLYSALKSGSKNISQIEAVAQSFIYLITSFGNISFTAHLVLYILSKKVEIQEKVRQEIADLIGEKYEISYDDLTKLQYLNQIIQETMRMYPLTARVVRDCTQTTTIKGIEIEKGVMFSVPVYAIHMNEEYYPNPHVFDPDRFSPEEVTKRDPLAFMPFGYGPRNCIAYRYVETVIKMVLVHSLKNFKFSSFEGSPGLPIKIITRGITKPAETLYAYAEKL